MLLQMARSQEHATSDLRQKLQAVVAEEQRLRVQIAEATRRVDELAIRRKDYDAQLDVLQRRLQDQEIEAVQRCLAEDRSRLAERADLWRKTMAEHDAEVERTLEGTDLGLAAAEYLRFRELEGNLKDFSLAIRQGILDRYEQASKRLEPVLRQIYTLPRVTQAPLPVSIVMAADPAEGPPQALVVVLPIPGAVAQDWQQWEDDLALMLACRVVTRVFHLLEDLGVADAPTQYTEVHGSLAMQIWLGDYKIQQNLQDAAMNHLLLIEDDAPELSAAGIELYGVWLDPVLLSGEAD